MRTRSRCADARRWRTGVVLMRWCGRYPPVRHRRLGHDEGSRVRHRHPPVRHRRVGSSRAGAGRNKSAAARASAAAGARRTGARARRRRRRGSRSARSRSTRRRTNKRTATRSWPAARRGGEAAAAARRRARLDAAAGRAAAGRDFARGGRAAEARPPPPAARGRLDGFRRRGREDARTGDVWVGAGVFVMFCVLSMRRTAILLDNNQANLLAARVVEPELGDDLPDRAGRRCVGVSFRDSRDMFLCVFLETAGVSDSYDVPDGALVGISAPAR